MSNPRSELMRILSERGFIHQGTDIEGLDRLFAEHGPITGYIGFDATAPSLHVGSLLQIMMLRWMQQTGHRPIVLMGGGTTKLGDPSFKDTARPLLSDEQIEANISGIRQVFGKYLRFGDGPTDAVMVNNADWLDTLSYIPFLREVGRHFSVNRMLSFDSVKLRLEREQPLTFLEFNYMILQGYDFVELHGRYGCQLQLGGSDQWGNIVNGIELGRRLKGADLYGLTSPLLTTASGGKMGKTADGAIWLNADSLSPYEFWQYWRNTEDADVGRFLRLFTDMPLTEIARLEALEGREINDAKKILANAVTALAHGEEAAQAAANTAQATFEQGALGADLPTVTLAADALAAGLGVVDAFVLEGLGLAASKGEVRRHIKGGGARVNDVAVADDQRVLGPQDVTDGAIKLSVGKKKHALIRVA